MVTTPSLPVVLVPGLACTPRLYAEQMPALWTFGPVLVADHRRGDSMDAIARQLLAQAPTRFALAGLSMGGYIALAVQRLAPDRVMKLALLDTGSRSDTPEASERRKASMEKVRAGEFDAVMDTLWPVLVHKNRRDDLALKRIVIDMAMTAGSDAFIRQQQAIMTRPDSRPGLPAIRCPTLVLVGEGDELTPPALADEMASLIPNSRLVKVLDSGHLSTLEKPDVVTKALVEWVQS
jgi:pimeloyl-ACP methyl ester carboxylesterase